MIFRVDEDNKLHQVELPPYIDEDDFLELQKGGQIKFIKVDESELPTLPPEISQKFENIRFYKIDPTTNKIIFDLDRIKKSIKKEIDVDTQNYINTIFQQYDLGDNEADALSSIQNTIDVNLGQILFILEQDLKKQNKDTSLITVSTFWKRTTLYLAGLYNEQDAINELKQIGVTEQTINSVIGKLKEIVNVAIFKLWDEEVWKASEQLKKQIDSAMDINEIATIISNFKYPDIPKLVA